MNLGYIYNNGDAVILDTKLKEISKVKYYDNLDEVLKKEDLVEIMESNLNKLKKSITILNKEKKVFKSCVFIPLLVCLLTPTISISFMSYIGNIYIDQILNLILTIFFFPIGLALCLGFNAKVNYIRKNVNGKLNQIKYLEAEINNIKKEIEELKKDLTNSKLSNKEIKSYKLDQKEMLKAYKNWLEIIYDLGYNEKKYLKYYQKGNLENKLKNYYEDEEIQLVKKHFDNKKSLRKILK